MGETQAFLGIVWRQPTALGNIQLLEFYSGIEIDESFHLSHVKAMTMSDAASCCPVVSTDENTVV